MTPSCANLVFLSCDETCRWGESASSRSSPGVEEKERTRLGARQDLGERVDVVGRRVQEEELALGRQQSLVALSLRILRRQGGKDSAREGERGRTTASSIKNECTVSLVKPGDAIMRTLSSSKLKWRVAASYTWLRNLPLACRAW